MDLQLHFNLDPNDARIQMSIIVGSFMENNNQSLWFKRMIFHIDTM